MSIDINEVVQQALEHGFYASVPLSLSTLKLMPEVRDMCAANTCHKYGQNWACPPGCGTLEECEARIRGYETGIIVQTVGDIEDSMDFEGMVAAEETHKKHFLSFADFLMEKYQVLPIGTGTCTRCASCTYPDAPCRFPDKITSSMEAYGMLVTQVCKDNNINYYYGNDKIAYTACYLLKEKDSI